MAARRPPARQFLRRRLVRVHQRVRRPVHAARHRRSARRARGGPRRVPRRGSQRRPRHAGDRQHRRGGRWPTRRWSSSTSGSATTSRTAGANPRDDVLTGLAAATFPDGSTPEVDRRRAGRRQPVRRRPGDHRATARHRGEDARRAPELQQRLRDEREPHPQLRRGDVADGEPGQGRLPAVARADDGRRRGIAGRHDGDGGQRGRQPRPAPVRATRRRSTPSAANARQHLAFGRGIHTCPGARSPGPRPGSASSGCWTAPPTSGSREAHHGPAGARRYRYMPTYILRGLTELHLEFTPPRAHPMKVPSTTDRCRGHGICLTLCPEVFDLLDDGYAVPRGRGAGRARGRVQEAIQNCPEQAISEIVLKTKEIRVPKGYIVITEDVKDPGWDDRIRQACR